MLQENGRKREGSNFWAISVSDLAKYVLVGLLNFTTTLNIYKIHIALYTLWNSLLTWLILKIKNNEMATFMLEWSVRQWTKPNSHFKSLQVHCVKKQRRLHLLSVKRKAVFYNNSVWPWMCSKTVCSIQVSFFSKTFGCIDLCQWVT